MQPKDYYSPPGPGLQSSPDWRPLRILTAAIITLISSYVIGSGLFLLLAAGSARSEACSELAIFLCIGAAGFLSAIVTFVIAFGLGYVLLRRKQVGNAGLLLLVTYLIGGLLSGRLYKLSSLPIGAYLAISFVLFVLFFIIFDWYLNVVRGSAVLKAVVLCLFVCTGAALSSLNGHGSGGVLSSSSKSRLRSELAQSGVTYLVPPPGSTYPQPYDIAAESGNDGIPDYTKGAYFGIDTGPANGTTLYEYPYNSGIDPIKDCGKISSLLVSPDGTTSCRLKTTLASGTRVYTSTSDELVSFFIIKHDIVVIYTPAHNMSDKTAGDFVDNLQPLEINSFLGTLHQKNPQQY